MPDEIGQQIRERLWVTKVDHTTDPPTPTEEVFIENGVVVETRDLRPLEGADPGPAVAVGPVAAVDDASADVPDPAQGNRTPADRHRWE